MKIKTLIKKLSKLNPEHEVILASDMEGNHYRVLTEVNIELGLKFAEHYGEGSGIELFTQSDITENPNDFPSEEQYRKAKNCVVLYRLALRPLNNDMTYSEIKSEIEAAPMTYLPGLLVAVVKTLTTKKVLKPGGASRIAQNVEDEVNGEPESVASGSPAATGSAAPCPSCEIYRKQWLNALDEGDNNKKLCDNLAGVLVAADGDDLIGIVETIIKQRDEANATAGKVMAWLENEAVKLDEGIKNASTHADHNRVCRLHGGIVTLSRLKDYIQQVQQNHNLCNLNLKQVI